MARVSIYDREDFGELYLLDRRRHRRPRESGMRDEKIAPLIREAQAMQEYRQREHPSSRERVD
jgi:hypothetical protein